MRALLPLLVVVLLIPASASAAPLGEVPPLDLRGDEWCVRATGTPGELAVPTPNGMRLVTATRDRLAPGRELRLGAAFDCGTVAGHPNGAAVITGETGAGDVMAIVREPGGEWGAPQTVIADDPDTDPLQVVAGISERGDAILGIKERAGEKGYRFRVSRRAPGGTFGAPEQLGATVPNTGALSVAAAATGEMFALFTTIEGKRAPYSEPVNVAIAPPGQPFGAPARIADTRWMSGPALAVAADGRALVTVPDATSVKLAEREPGAAAFGPASVIASMGDDGATFTSVRVGANGAAAIAWVRARSDEVTLLQRAAAGPFSGPRAVLNVPSLPANFDPFYISQTFFSQIFGTNGDIGGIFTRGEPSSFLTLGAADGRALITSATGPLSDSEEGVALASATVDAVQTGFAGGGPNRPNRSFPFTFADGTTAVAWSTPLSAPLRYRLHVASAATVERPDPTPPRVTVGRQDRERIAETRPLRLPITCSGPCEVNAYVDFGGITIPYGLKLSKAGTRGLKLDSLELITSRKLTRVRIQLAYGAPGALHPRTRTITVRVRRSGPDDPHAAGLKAVRRGDQVVVTFRVLGDTDDWGAYITGDDTREWSGEPAVSRIVEGRDGKRSYRLTLPAAGVNYVTLRTPRVLTLPGQKLITKVR